MLFLQLKFLKYDYSIRITCGQPYKKLEFKTIKAYLIYYIFGLVLFYIIIKNSLNCFQIFLLSFHSNIVINMYSVYHKSLISIKNNVQHK